MPAFRAGVDNVNGIASLDTRPMQRIATEQGVIELPYETNDVGYMPSAMLLNSLPEADTRLTGISDRYYR